MKWMPLAFCTVSLVAVWQPPSRADLSNPFYVEGAKAYHAGDFAAASRWLIQYRQLDAAFLGMHPDIEQRVDAAIDFCMRHKGTDSSFKGDGWIPNNLPNGPAANNSSSPVTSFTGQGVR